MTKIHTCTEYLPVALQAYEHWRVHEAGFSLRTWSGEKPGLLAFVDAMLAEGVAYCDGVTYDHVREWWTSLCLADSTKSTRLHQLRTFLEYCCQIGRAHV